MRDKIRSLPTWVGLLGAIALAVLGTVGVVQLYARGWLPVAGPFVVVVCAPLLLWLRVTVLRVRTLRRRQALTEKLGNLLRLVTAERNQPAGERVSAATDRSLTEARLVVRSAQDLLAANRADAVTVVGQLGGVSERWQPAAPLTRTVQEAVVAAQRLAVVWGEVADVRART